MDAQGVEQICDGPLPLSESNASSDRGDDAEIDS